jgi:hypothetical protein
MSTAVMERKAAGSTPAEQSNRPSAVVWINDRRAIVARVDRDGTGTTRTVDRSDEPEPVFLDLVVRAIGDRERVVILGPSVVRLALEREYVAINQRPDRLVDVEPAGPVDEAELVDRVRELAG